MKESYRLADENELIKASLEGNASAFEEIVSRYRRLVARTVKGMLGDSVYAEDIGQEVFIKLYYSCLNSEVRQNCQLISRELQ